MPFTATHQRDLSQVSQVDWARLAAFIDGEGCISIKSVHGKRAISRRVMYVNVTISNTDFRLPVWLQQTFGGSVRYDKRGNVKWKAVSQWNVASRYACRVLEYCLPYFVMKRDQAEVVLAFQATVLPDRRYGVKGRPEELIAKQNAFKEQIHALKGTSSRNRRDRTGDTIQ